MNAKNITCYNEISGIHHENSCTTQNLVHSLNNPQCMSTNQGIQAKIPILIFLHTKKIIFSKLHLCVLSLHSVTLHFITTACLYQSSKTSNKLLKTNPRLIVEDSRGFKRVHKFSSRHSFVHSSTTRLINLFTQKQKQ